MSHIQKLNEAKSHCRTIGQCNEYQTLLLFENQKIDTYTANNIQSATTWGLIIGMIGFAVFLTPFIKPLQRIQRFILPMLIIITPILAGIAAGAFAGFAISFSACYKQLCSPLESSAIILIPIVTLIPTIPLAIKIYRKRQAIVDKIDKPNTIVWMTIGLLIIAVAISITMSKISDSKKFGEAQKQYLLNSEL